MPIQGVGLELVEVYEAPETHVGIVEQLLTDADIPYVRGPGVSGYPMVEPFVRLSVPADRSDEALNLIRLGPAMPPPPPLEERQLGYAPEMEKPLAIAFEAPEEARNLANQYLDGHPDDINAWDCAAIIADISGEHSDAEAVLRDGLAANPNHPWLRSRLGYYIELQGRLKEAQAIYKDLLVTNPDAPHGYAGLATIALRKNRPDEAREFAESASERLHPIYHPRLGSDIALLWLDIGEVEPALEILQTHVNWFRRGGIALMVAVILEQDTDEPDDVVDEAFDDARRYWNSSRDGSWDEVLDRTRLQLEKRNFFTRFDDR